MIKLGHFTFSNVPEQLGQKQYLLHVGAKCPLKLRLSPLLHEHLIQLHPPYWRSIWKYVLLQNVCDLQGG